MKRNEVKLSFCIWGFNDINHDELTEILEIKPSKIFIEGKRLNPKFPRLAKENGWFIDPPVARYASFSEKMTALLNIIEARREKLESICKRYYCEFSCAIYIYNDEESTPSVHLDSRYNNVTRDLNIEFDMDLYFLQNAKLE